MRPIPLHFTPPQGAVGSPKLDTWSLMVTTPATSSRCSRRAVSSLRVQPLAVRPYGLSFASRMASSSESTARIGSTGPKVSSRRTVIVWSTSTRTVGG